MFRERKCREAFNQRLKGLLCPFLSLPYSHLSLYHRSPMYSTRLCLHDLEWSFVPSNIESCLTRIRCDVLTKSSSRNVPIWSSPGVYTWMFPCELMCFFIMCWNVCAREKQAFPVIGPSLMNIQTSDKERSHKQSWSQLVSRRRERVGADFPTQSHVHVCVPTHTCTCSIWEEKPWQSEP